MKKIISIIFLMLSLSFLIGEEFEWFDYEKLCWINDSEPSFEEYELLCSEKAQCYGDSEEKAENLLKGIDD